MAVQSDFRSLRLVGGGAKALTNGSDMGVPELDPVTMYEQG